MNAAHAQLFVSWQVETRRRMQAEYERKMTTIRQDTAQKQADDAKRQQQRSAQISRLQSATEVCICNFASAVEKLAHLKWRETTCCFSCTHASLKRITFQAVLCDNIILQMQQSSDENMTCFVQSQAARERIEAARQEHPMVSSMRQPACSIWPCKCPDVHILLPQ